MRAVAEEPLVHGQEYLCVVKYSASFAGEQLHSLTTSLSKVPQALRRFSMELNQSQARWKEHQIHSKIQRWLPGQFVSFRQACVRRCVRDGWSVQLPEK
jgi:hypothetical protein